MAVKAASKTIFTTYAPRTSCQQFILYLVLWKLKCSKRYTVHFMDDYNLERTILWFFCNFVCIYRPTCILRVMVYGGCYRFLISFELICTIINHFYCSLFFTLSDIRFLYLELLEVDCRLWLFHCTVFSVTLIWTWSGVFAVICLYRHFARCRWRLLCCILLYLSSTTFLVPFPVSASDRTKNGIYSLSLKSFDIFRWPGHFRSNRKTELFCQSYTLTI